MARFSLSGLIAGAGKGMTDAGKTMVATGAQLSLEQERAKVQALRDEATRKFTTSERVAGEKSKAVQSALDRASQERRHTETLAASERTTAASILKNATDNLKMARADYATNDTNPQYVAALKSAENDYRDALSVAKSRLGATSTTKDAETPKAGKRNWRAFAPGAAAEESAVAVETPPKSGKDTDSDLARIIAGGKGAPFATKPTAAPKQETAAEEPEPAKPDQHQLDMDRLKEIEKALGGKDLDFWEGGIIKQMREGGRYLSPGERNTLEVERTRLQKKLSQLNLSMEPSGQALRVANRDPVYPIVTSPRGLIGAPMAPRVA